MKYLLLLIAVVIIVSCDRKYAAYSYCPTSVSGWNTQDTLRIDIDTIQESGSYSIAIGVRSTRFFPYQILWLQAELELESPRMAFRDTIDCRIADDKGNFLGKGLSLHENVYFLKTVVLHEGQYGRMKLRHIMRRDPLPGISDVGVIIKKTS